MQLITTNYETQPMIEIVEAEEIQRNPFILGNTKEMDLQTLQDDYLVPVFSRDNNETISHCQLVHTIYDAIQTNFQGEQFLEPRIRVSHEMKLRTRKGSGKLVEQLTDEDSGSYYQRMMFMIEIPSIRSEIDGCDLALQVVGVRSYHETNLLGNSSQKQQFQIGIGMLNQVCCNMCLISDGINTAIKVTNTADLYKYAMELFSQYNYKKHEEQMKRLCHTMIDVKTFAQLLGKCRMYNALPQKIKTELNLPELILNEAQINAAVRDYYTDENFGGYGGSISGWKLYNLITNYKNNYIDTTLDRSVNAFDLVSGVVDAINGVDKKWSWFIE